MKHVIPYKIFESHRDWSQGFDRKDPVPVETLVKLSDSPDNDIRTSVAGHPDTPPEILASMASDTWSAFRNTLACMVSLLRSMLVILAGVSER